MSETSYLGETHQLSLDQERTVVFTMGQGISAFLRQRYGCCTVQLFSLLPKQTIHVLLVDLDPVAHQNRDGRHRRA